MSANVSSFINGLGSGLVQVKDTIQSGLDRAGRMVMALVDDLANGKTMITHLKCFDAIESVRVNCFGHQLTTQEENTRATLKVLKGWNAIGTLSTEAAKVKDKMIAFWDQPSVRGAADSTVTTSGLVNKLHDIATFLGTQIAIPFFQNLSEAYKAINMQALGVGSAIRGFFSAEKIITYITGKSDDVNELTAKAGMTNMCEMAASVGSLSLAGGFLMGYSPQWMAVSGAVYALSSSANYFVSKLA